MLGTTFDLLLVLFGFGLIVFLHELGHFLAARWAGIRVLAFAVGFGPAFVSFRKGLGISRGSSEQKYQELLRKPGAADSLSPTEYRLNMLPFGGYVKMLGQEDGNPYAISEANDSYQKCKPWKRMIVISAGVVMNIITAAVLFVLVFSVGMKVDAAKVGAVAPGSPAARVVASNAASLGVTEPGIRPGDSIITINGTKPNSFSDLMLATAMSEKDTFVEVTVSRKGIAQPLTFMVKPQSAVESGMLEMGIEPARAAAVITGKTPQENADIAQALNAAGLTGVEPGMSIQSVDGRPVEDATELFTSLQHSHGKPVEAIFADPAGKQVRHAFTPRPELQVDYLPRSETAVTPIDHILGLVPVMTVAESRDERGQPLRGELQGLRKGDIFARINAVEFPSVAAGMAEIQSSKGRTIPIVVLRKNAAGQFEEVSLPRVEVTAKGQIGFGAGDTGRESTLIAVPLPLLMHPGTEERFTPPASGVFKIPGATIVSINGVPVKTFAEIRDALRATTKPDSKEGSTVAVRLRSPTSGTISADAPVEELAWTLAPKDISALHTLGWASPISPGIFQTEEVLLKASSPSDALRMGFIETRRVMLSTYSTFVRLYQGTVKVEHLKGPVGIAHLGTLVAGRGFIWLLFFLALISVNLAVVNFLPLPIVDGGQFLFLVFEQIRGKPAPLAVQSAATRAGLALIGCVFLIVTYNDIRNLLGF